MGAAEAEREVWQNKHLLSPSPRAAALIVLMEFHSFVFVPRANTDYAPWPKARLITNPTDQVGVFQINCFQSGGSAAETACCTTSGDDYLQTFKVYLARTIWGGKKLFCFFSFYRIFSIVRKPPPQNTSLTPNTSPQLEHKQKGKSQLCFLQKNSQQKRHHFTHLFLNSWIFKDSRATYGCCSHSFPLAPPPQPQLAKHFNHLLPQLTCAVWEQRQQQQQQHGEQTCTVSSRGGRWDALLFLSSKNVAASAFGVSWKLPCAEFRWAHRTAARRKIYVIYSKHYITLQLANLFVVCVSWNI